MFGLAGTWTGEACRGISALRYGRDCGDIDTIDDVGLLGSGVFSRWRYITHWKYDSVPDEDDLEWFRLALGRLRELA
ncbi:MAG: hypothetical protein ACLS89_07930 [Collinsella sp.]